MQFLKNVKSKSSRGISPNFPQIIWHNYLNESEMNMTSAANGNTRLSHQFVDAITNHSREKWTLKMKNKKPIDINNQTFHLSTAWWTVWLTPSVKLKPTEVIAQLIKLNMIIYLLTAQNYGQTFTDSLLNVTRMFISAVDKKMGVFKNSCDLIFPRGRIRIF